ncbi:hypothetical protein [Kitasatospora sp. A2-31]|uniref:hypothetical protein n=1 Tax=Kitasatospora sp. A2-31 TaxID=2916414 RepID=UPI001EEBF22B|nr:hypothetical protein [Kitasatospora sp. A2-31]MCG6494897.1 hypothetical protein [Kitasatospora sp. A2-31]
MGSTGRNQLERRLHMGEVDDSELRNILVNFFPSGQYQSDRSVELTNGRARMRITYDKKTGAISNLTPLSGLTNQLLDQIELEVKEKLLVAPVRKVAKAILYSHVPVDGYWRFKDQIVLRPVPPGSPQPPFLLADHPLICEISYLGAPDPWVNGFRSARAIRQYTLILSLLIPGLKIPNASAKGWVLVPTWSTHDPAAPIDDLHSEYAQFGYHCTGALDGPADSLSSRGDLPEIQLKPPGLGISIGDSLTLRPDISEHLQAFSNLDSEDRRRILRASYWMHLARQVFSSSNSASFQFFIQAIEAMTITSDSAPDCEECRRPIADGPTKLFNSFIGQYAPPTGSPEDKRARRLLYDTRSDLTHGSSLLEMDEETGFIAPTPNQIAESGLHRTAADVCRAALLGWLRSHTEPPHSRTPSDQSEPHS